LASSGFYLHQRKLITADGRKSLAIISQQVAIPALFFSKIIYCPQDSKKEECPNVLEHLSDVWILLLWPLYVVGCGLLVGEAAAILSFTPLCHRKMVRVACGFANSTGLPLTLLAVLHANFPATGSSRVDPSIFLSIYVLVYQILQWGVGGWLLAEPRDSPAENISLRRGVHHVLNSVHSSVSASTTNSKEMHLESTRSLSSSSDILNRPNESTQERRLSLSNSIRSTLDNTLETDEEQTFSLIRTNHAIGCEDQDEANSSQSDIPSDVAPLMVTVFNVLSEALQPPVIGALLGLFVAAIRPLRALFVDLRDRDDDAPLEWFYDGVYVVCRYLR
jgi:predicted permease